MGPVCVNGSIGMEGEKGMKVHVIHVHVSHEAITQYMYMYMQYMCTCNLNDLSSLFLYEG